LVLALQDLINNCSAFNLSTVSESIYNSVVVLLPKLTSPIMRKLSKIIPSLFLALLRSLLCPVLGLQCRKEVDEMEGVQRRSSS